MPNRRFGFSTGALEKGNYREAINWMRRHEMRYVELSALRYDELEPLVNDLDALPVKEFDYVSFHAPSSFPKEQEAHVISLLDRVYVRNWNIVVHPDVIYTPDLWQHFGRQLLLENMDRRKETGRTVADLDRMLHDLPQAQLCLDVAHARQMDTTLTLLWNFTTQFKNRIAEVHISELDSHCRHLPLSSQAIMDYQRFASALCNIPVIIESMLYKDQSDLREQEIQLAQAALSQGTTTT
jgi:Xylose isomerase-like TIM barrel